MRDDSMELDGSMMGAIVAAFVALAATGSAYGRNYTQINRLKTQVVPSQDWKGV